MSKNPNVLDVEDYFNLSMKDRGIFDDWLKSLGGHPALTKQITLDKTTNTVTCIEYSFDSYDRKNYTKNVPTGEQEVVLSYREDPPLWKAY